MADDQDGRGRSPPTFTTLPIRACSDKRLTGTDLRVLGVIGFHDRRSIARGAGAGCFAGQRLIAQRAGLDRKNVRQSIERLVTLGYLERTERASEKGGYVLRVIEVDPSAPAEPIGGAGTPYADDDDDFHSFEQGVQEPPRQGVQEPPHRGLGDPLNRDIRDLAKARRDSPQGAHLCEGAGEKGFPGKDVKATVSPEAHHLMIVATIAANLLGSNRELAMQAGVNETNTSNARNGRHVTQDAAKRLLETGLRTIEERKHEHPLIDQFGEFGLLLPASFLDKPGDVQLSILERTLKLGLPEKALDHAREPLDAYLESFCGDPDDLASDYRALRIMEALAAGEYG